MSESESSELDDLVYSINDPQLGHEIDDYADEIYQEDEYNPYGMEDEYEDGDDALREQVERLFLVKLDKKCAQLQQDGKYSEALILMEQGLTSRVQLFGEHSDEVLAASEEYILLCNSLAMSFLYKEKYSLCLRALRKAEELAVTSPALSSCLIQTLNNLACCYRRMKKPKVSLKLLNQTLAILSSEEDLGTRVVTHLNICAILSQLGRHQEAHEHAKAAVLYCQKQLLGQDLKQSLNEQGDQHSLLTEKIVVLGIAYHNLGVEEEFLGKYSACLQWYYKALQLAKTHLGPDEDITNTFRISFANAKKAVRESRPKHERPATARPATARPKSAIRRKR